MSGNYLSEIIENKKLNDNTFAITVDCAELASAARAGQFIHIKCGEALLLRRPIGLCNVRGCSVTFVFEVKGKGTRWLSECLPGYRLDILGPLGNGFSFPDNGCLIVGGGAGAPPMLFAARSAKAAEANRAAGAAGEMYSGAAAVIGFRDSSRVILQEEFKDVCDKLYITTDDGSYGLRGSVAGAVEELLKSGGYGTVLACGNRPMLTAVACLCEQYGVSCQVSLEERMGCGVGACLVCACATVIDGAPRMKRVCKDGPVFDAKEIVWD